ncbi:MAG: thioredoxin-disulfide reductase [Spirochaetaceae bacterium]|nr:MAG: thioredoxin-disulfide reductase [Spirochaetaceae bacterium]
MEADRDVIIIGAGAAGLTAAQYAARANLNTLLLEELAPGGQCLIIDNLENYPGFPDPLPGIELSQKFEEQARNFGAEILTSSVQSVSKHGKLFTLDTDSGPLTAPTVIVATGAKHKKLGIPGEEQFSGRGVSYCATCDGPFFKGKRMLVAGGGDAACDEAMFLAKLTDQVIMVHRRDRFRAQRALAERTLKNPNIEVRWNTEAKAIKGDGKVEGVVLLRNDKNETYEEKVEAVFVFIGSIPQTQVVKNLEVKMDEAGYIVTNQRMETNIPGLYAVGDVRATPFRQLVVAAGEGAIAAHAAAQHIDELKGEAYV